MRLTDTEGNVIFTDRALDRHGYPVPGFDVYILPAGQTHRRQLARYLADDDALLIERDSSAPIHQRHGGYHINTELLTCTPASKLILVEIDTGTAYIMRCRDVFAEGQPQLHERTGLARQVFILREWCDHYRITVPAHLDRIKAMSPTLSKKPYL